MKRMGQLGFIFGIIGFFCFPFSIVSIALFYLDKDESEENLKYGKIGAILGFINMTMVALLGIVSIVFGILFPIMLL